MRNLLLSILLMISTIVLAENHYVYYNTNDCIPQIVGTNLQYTADSVAIDGTTMGGIDWTVIQVAKFTNDIPIDFTSVTQVDIVRVLPQTIDEHQAAKSIEIKYCENTFMLICQQLTGTNIKCSFSDLKFILDDMSETNFAQCAVISLNLLSIDAELKREEGLLWWDDCAWHPDLSMLMYRRSKIRALSNKGFLKASK